MTAAQLGVTPRPRPCLTDVPVPKVEALSNPSPTATTRNRNPPSRVRQGRLSILSWNIGRLSVVKWDMLRAWLHNQALNCLTFTGEWHDSSYAYLHTGAHQGRSGLLTVVKRSFCELDDIAWTTTLDSRIQHVRLYELR